MGTTDGASAKGEEALCVWEEYLLEYLTYWRVCLEVLTHTWNNYTIIWNKTTHCSVGFIVMQNVLATHGTCFNMSHPTPCPKTQTPRSGIVRTQSTLCIAFLST